MPDLHGWITQQINKTQRIAEAARGQGEGRWNHETGYHSGRVVDERGETVVYDEGAPLEEEAAHIALNDPATVLRRCTADRKILDEHKPYGGNYLDRYACTGCGEYRDDWVIDHTNDCPTLQALAEGYGLTAEQLAAARTELALLREGEEPYVHEHTEATPAQWIWHWNRATREERLGMAARIQDAFARSSACFMGGHEARLDQQQARITRLEAEREQGRSRAADYDEYGERQRARADQAEELLRVAHETSNRAEAERARAMRIAEEAEMRAAIFRKVSGQNATRAERAEQRRDQLAATLDDVLRHFTQAGHPGEACLTTGWITKRTVAKWRAVLNPTTTKEQP